MFSSGFQGHKTLHGCKERKAISCPCCDIREAGIPHALWLDKSWECGTSGGLLASEGQWRWPWQAYLPEVEFGWPWGDEWCPPKKLQLLWFMFPGVDYHSSPSFLTVPEFPRVPRGFLEAKKISLSWFAGGDSNFGNSCLEQVRRIPSPLPSAIFLMLPSYLIF